jgi:hypothetical protein
MLAAKSAHQHTPTPAVAKPQAAAHAADTGLSALSSAAWASVALGIQPKLTVNEPDDEYEREADSVADQVMRMADPALVNAAPLAIQRTCACGGSGGESCSCHDHDDETIHTKPAPTRASRAPDMASALAAADRARGAGVPLSPAVRSYFEPRFAHDFSNVRVHADDSAATAARGIQARAYTLGQNVVFGAGEFAPDSDRGMRLLAHELTHVVQQSGGAAPAAIAPKLIATPGATPTIQRDAARVATIDATAQKLIDVAANSRTDAGVRAVSLVWGILQAYYPAESKALWVNVVSYEEATPGLATTQTGTGASSQGKIVVGKDFREHSTEGEFEQRVADVGNVVKKIELWRRGKDVPASCEPTRRLTWADFKGAVGAWTAFTAFDHTLETVGGEQVVRATFAPSRSYVKAAVKDPANRATSGCGAAIKGCETLLAGKKNVTLPLAAGTTCAAGVKPDPSVVATSSAECSSVLGPECDRTRQAESERLLRHEQLHFDIACLLAQKGTRAISLKPTEAARILQAVKDKAHELTNDNGAYDSETDHSCNASGQAAWDQSVARGMPMVVIT